MRAKGYCVTAASAILSWSCSSASRKAVPSVSAQHCLPAGDFAAQVLLGSARMYGRTAARKANDVAGDSASRVAGDSLSRAGEDSPSQISEPPAPRAEIVDDDSKCSRAALALDSAHIGGARTPVYLVTMGTHYLVYRRGTDVMVHLDRRFTVLEQLVGQ
jgi:hypothetical protein